MRTRSVRALSALWFAACISISSQAQDERIRPIETDCAEAPFPLPYLSYGITVPPQQGEWSCTAYMDADLSPPNSTVTWEKSGKKIEFFELILSERIPDDLLPKKNKQQPEATIRSFIEIFFKDKNVLKKNESLKNASEIYADAINGIVWSKYNERAIAYTFYGGNQETNEREETNAFIFKKGQDKEFMVVNCWGCSLQEFFSLVIAPVVQD
jgi:hypothetical protein